MTRRGRTQPEGNMKTLTLWQIDMIPWYVFAAYWLVTWLRVKRTKMMESLAQRFLTIVPMGLAFELLFSRSLAVGPLQLRFVPAVDWIGWSGDCFDESGRCDCDLGTLLHRPVLEFPGDAQRGASAHSLGAVRICAASDLYGDADRGHGHGSGDRRVARSLGRDRDVGGTFFQGPP